MQPEDKDEIPNFQSDQSIITGLKESGVSESRIFFESFGKPMKIASERQAPDVTVSDGVKAAEIVFVKSGKTLN